MALQSDSRGFLVGDPIDLKRMPNDISHIRDDVSAIRRAIAERGRNFSRADRALRPGTATPTGSRRLDPVQAAISEGARSAVAERIRRVSSASGTVLPGRDSSGRFANGSDGAGGSGGSGGSGLGNSVIATIGDRLARLTGVASGIEDADPSVKAMREVAEPLQRGFELFRGDKQTSWLKKIFKSLNIFHKEDTVYNKAAKKSLKAIEEGQANTVNGSSGGIGAIGGLIAGLGGKKALMMMLKKTPVLGSILGLLGIGADVAAIEGDGSLTRREKNKEIGTDVGGFGGTVAGMLAGGKAGAVLGSFLGPAGTAVGGVVGAGIGMLMGDKFGQVVGSTFGDWVTDLSEADIPGKILSAWDSAVGKFSAAWDQVKSVTGKAVDVAKEQINDANSYLNKRSGIDVKDMAGKWLERTQSNIGGMIAGAKSGFDWLGKNTTTGKISSRISGSRGSAEEAMQILMDKGWTKDDAAAIAANLNRESGFDPRARGDNGQAIGAAQWHKPRQDQFEKLYGKKLADASFEEQIAFVDWEMRNTYKKAGAAIRSASGVKSKTAAVEQFYEQSALGQRGGVQPERIADAIKYAAINVSGAPIAQVPKAPSMPPISEAPKVVEPLSSPTPPQFTINLPSQDVGQDLRDKRIAHIASGGISRL